MYSYKYGSITVLELIQLFSRFIPLTFIWLYQLLIFPFTQNTHSLYRTLWRTFVQTLCPPSSPRQMQFLSPRVAVLYESFIRAHKHRLEVIHEQIPGDASLHWIGPKSVQRVMLYIHGGGYVLPALNAHFEMVDYWRTQVKKKHDIDISVAFLEYSLVNHAPWPTQPRQTAAALAHLLAIGFEPQNILLAGDSVGGHMVAFLLCHLLHPHPSIEPIPPLSAPLAGAALISPWLTFSDAAPSFARNAPHDLMPVPALNKWSALLKASRTQTDDAHWFEPAEAPPKWWAGLGAAVRAVLITAGSGEVMFDDIVAAEHTMRLGAGSEVRIEGFVEDAGHNEAIVQFACGDVPCATTDRVGAWMAGVFA